MAGATPELVSAGFRAGALRQIFDVTGYPAAVQTTGPDERSRVIPQILTGHERLVLLPRAVDTNFAAQVALSTNAVPQRRCQFGRIEDWTFALNVQVPVAMAPLAGNATALEGQGRARMAGKATGRNRAGQERICVILIAGRQVPGLGSSVPSDRCLIQEPVHVDQKSAGGSPRTDVPGQAARRIGFGFSPEGKEPAFRVVVNSVLINRPPVSKRAAGLWGMQSGSRRPAADRHRSPGVGAHNLQVAFRAHR